MTAEELLALNVPDKRTELVRGRLVVREPAGYLHGRVAAEVGRALAEHVNANDLGVVLAAETGFTLARGPDTVRAPDAAFIAKQNIPDPEPEGFAEIAPDLVVEVLSPDERPGAVLSKVGDWLEAGVQLVWVIDPKRRILHAYRADGTESLLSESDYIDGENVVPGFRTEVTTFL
jgi:Uma2 family endonuclease